MEHGFTSRTPENGRLCLLPTTASGTLVTTCNFSRTSTGRSLTCKQHTEMSTPKWQPLDSHWISWPKYDQQEEVPVNAMVFWHFLTQKNVPVHGVSFALLCGLAFALLCAHLRSLPLIYVFLRPIAFRTTAFGNCRTFFGPNKKNSRSEKAILGATFGFLGILGATLGIAPTS